MAIPNPTKSKLLFITQRVNERDDDLAFVLLWVDEFIRQGLDVEVVCLNRGEFDNRFPVHSLGKELGYGKLRQVARFFRYIFSLKYDRVFVHMNPEYFTLAGWYWWLRGVPSYLWYTHYTMHVHLRLAGIFSKRMFAATPQSLPQYDQSPKKVVTGHGIDIAFWEKGRVTGENTSAPTRLVSIHRLSRSKRLEIGIRALKELSPDYTLDVYGRDVEPEYYAEIKEVVQKEGMESRVSMKGPLPMADLRTVYPRYRVMVNMAMETIDKTMLEGMLFGVYPVTTPANSIAIGLPVYPKDETPEAVAEFIRRESWRPFSGDYLSRIVEERHSLSALIAKMKYYIEKGV